MKKRFKTMELTLISGKKRRIVKDECVDVQEQYIIGGGIDVVVIMQSGIQYLVDMSKQQVLAKLER